MSVTRTIFMAAMAVVLLTNVSSLHAQAPRQGTPVVPRPKRATISPYLNLARDQSGPLPSYQAFVLPRLDQQQQQLAQRWLQARTQNLENAVLEDPSLRATGVGGGFQNYTHFYPARQKK